MQITNQEEAIKALVCFNTTPYSPKFHFLLFLRMCVALNWVNEQNLVIQGYIHEAVFKQTKDFFDKLNIDLSDLEDNT